MKTASLLLFTLLGVAFVMSSCKSTEDEFNDANDDVAQKYITRFEIIAPENVDDFEDVTVVVIYDAQNRVSSIKTDYSDESSTQFFNYSDSTNLRSITNSDESFNMAEILLEPYRAYLLGNVTEYDDNANPSKIEVYEDDYGSDLLYGDISYDPNPNPFFYTLKAAGIIDLLDVYDLNFGFPTPSYSKARMFLPMNNIRTITLKDLSGETVEEIQFIYEYDSDHYPTSATVYFTSIHGSANFPMYYYYK
jgi:hypothetical protein